MGATSDDLTRPLGQTKPPPARGSLLAGRIARFGIVGFGLFVIGSVVGSAIYGDSKGGRPVARTEIASAPRIAPAEQAAAESQPSSAVPVPRRDAGQVEESSGVQVVRVGGAAAPASIVVEVPQASRALSRAPDPRLTEALRFGLLPRIGQDGSRAIDVYARPVIHLPDGRPALGRIAIVVGGLGLSRNGTDIAIAMLPAAVSLAFAPYGADLQHDGERARQAGHETLLQIPMEPFDYPDSDPGPRTLTVAARPADNLENLRWAMGRFTGYVAIMNYMGGKLTADEKAIGAVLREADQRGIGFLDDGTSSRSRVSAAGGDGRIARADLVIDGVPRADMIDKALQQLETLAKSGRLVVATANALPVTVDRIAQWARTLEARGILLVPVSAAMVQRRRDSASR